jgi:hypothetical protein
MDEKIFVLFDVTRSDLLEMTVCEMVKFRIDDREFTIIDSEFLRDIAEKAKIKFVTVDG